VGFLSHGAAHFGGAWTRRHACVTRRAPLAARPCARAAPETRPPSTAASLWHCLRASQCVLARGTLACGADSAGLGLLPAVGCSLTALPTFAAPGRGGTRAWRGVLCQRQGPVLGLRLNRARRLRRRRFGITCARRSVYPLRVRWRAAQMPGWGCVPLRVAPSRRRLVWRRLDAGARARGAACPAGGKALC
jgi:hypothetical protein